MRLQTKKPLGCAEELCDPVRIRFAIHSLGLTQTSSAHFVGCGLFHLSALTSQLVTPPNKKAPRLRRRAL